MGKKINRILLDCSETYIENLNTGIQRAVKNIVQRSEKISKKYDIPIIPIILDSKNGYVDLRFFINQKNNFSDAGDNKNKQKKFIKKILKEKFKLKETDDIFKFSKFLWHLMKRFKYWLIGIRRMYRSSLLPSAKAVLPQEGDLLILLDGFWGYRYNNYFTLFCRHIKKKGGIITAVMYDIIPLTNPEFFEKELTMRFKSKFNALKNSIDIIMTISKNESENIKNYLKENFKIENKKISYFDLGCDFADKSKESKENKDTENSGGIIRKDLIEIIETMKTMKTMETVNPPMPSKKLYLMVGTIEPRKGYDYTLEAFEELWSGGFTGVLVIAGKIGWDVEEVIKKIGSSAYVNKNLFVFNDLNDEELDFLYNKADAAICASKREGFSLPMAEAAFYGVKVLASDIPVFREIGEKYTVFSYFNPQKADLVEAIKEFENKTVKTVKTVNEFSDKDDFNFVKWNQSVDAFFSKIFTLCETL